MKFFMKMSENYSHEVALINTAFLTGDKVVIQSPFGELDFGVIKFSNDGCFYKVHLESGGVLQWNSTLDPVPKIGLYDRPLLVGTRVRHLGKQGRVFATNKIVTAILADSSASDEKIIFPNLRENLLFPVLGCTVGDSVTYNGWIGLVTKGKVDVSYEFESGVTCVVIQDLESVHGFDYRGKRFPKLPLDVIESGKWSGGLRYYNIMKYRNASAKILGLEIVSLSIFWIDRMKKTDANNEKPETEVTGKMKLASVFGLANPSRNKFRKNSVFMLRWDESLFKNYRKWQERFATQYILGEPVDNDEDEELNEQAKKISPFTNRDRLAVKVLFFQTESEIIFDDGTTVTTMATNIAEILPRQSIKVTFPDQHYSIGKVVKDRMDFLHPDKYGFILSQNPLRRTCQVKWVIVNTDKTVTIQTNEMSQYDILLNVKYQSLNNTPQVVLARGIFEGVITGLSLSDGKVKVRCAEGPVKSFYPHELEFSTKKAFTSLFDQSYTIESYPIEDVVPSSLYCIKNSGSANLHSVTTSGPRERVTLSQEVGSDHSFINSVPPVSVFRPEILNMLDQEIFEIAHSSDYDVWIESFKSRGDLLTAAIVGPNQTLYKGILFFLDILIPSDYPNSVPQVVFKVPSAHYPVWFRPYVQEDGQLRIPPEVLQAVRPCDESPLAKTFRFISNLFENNNNNSMDNNNELESKDFNESTVITVSEYLHTLLCQPPRSWKDLVENHFCESLPRIYWSFSKYLETPEEFFNDNLTSLNKRAGCDFLLHPTSESFKLAMKSRLDNLRHFMDSIQCDES